MPASQTCKTEELRLQRCAALSAAGRLPASPSMLSTCFFLLSKKNPALPRFASSLPHANPTLSKQYSHAHAQTRLDAREGCTVDPLAFRKELNTDTRRAAAPLQEHRVCVPSCPVNWSREKALEACVQSRCAQMGWQLVSIGCATLAGLLMFPGEQLQQSPIYTRSRVEAARIVVDSPASSLSPRLDRQSIVPRHSVAWPTTRRPENNRVERQ